MDWLLLALISFALFWVGVLLGAVAWDMRMRSRRHCQHPGELVRWDKDTETFLCELCGEPIITLTAALGTMPRVVAELHQSLAGLATKYSKLYATAEATKRGLDLLGEKMTQRTITLPPGLHPETKELVARFAEAMAEKLYEAQQKGKSGWQDSDWMDECRERLREHVEKGDPRDVANLCAFLWYHNEPTT